MRFDRKHAERRMEEKRKERMAVGGLSVMVVVLPCDERLNVFDVFDVFDVYCLLFDVIGSFA